MNTDRITRRKAEEDKNLKEEVEYYANIPKPRRELPRTPTESIYNAPVTSTPRPTDISGTFTSSELGFNVNDATIQGTELRYSLGPEEVTRIKLINSDKDKDIITKMTNHQGSTHRQPISWKDALRIVPDFNGKNINLTQFLDSCDRAHTLIAEEDKPTIHLMLESKLSGEAQQVYSHAGLNSYEELKEYFRGIYTPSSTVHELVAELEQQFQRDNESVIAFANRMRGIGAQILDAQRLAEGTIDDTFKRQTQKHIITCFKRGLQTEIENRLPENDDVSETIKSAIKIEKELEAKRALRGN